MANPTPTTTDPKHFKFMNLALQEAHKCTGTPTAYCVGALLTTPDGKILSTGYSRELPGNTHAEQCCFDKLTAAGQIIPADVILYTTMEPCSERLSGNVPCVQRVLDAGIKTVYVGVEEPVFFVVNTGREQLAKGGVNVVKVVGLEQEIGEVAIKGHQEAARASISDFGADDAIETTEGN